MINRDTGTRAVNVTRVVASRLDDETVALKLTLPGTGSHAGGHGASPCPVGGRALGLPAPAAPGWAKFRAWQPPSTRGINGRPVSISGWQSGHKETRASQGTQGLPSDSSESD